MPDVVNVHEAKTYLSRLLERVRSGEEIILAKAATPCARLIRLGKPPERKPGQYPGRVTDDPQLSGRARAVIADRQNELLVSAASPWEWRRSTVWARCRRHRRSPRASTRS